MWTGRTRFRIHKTWTQKAAEYYHNVNDRLQATYYNGANPTGPQKVNYNNYMNSTNTKAFYEATQNEFESFFSKQNMDLR